MPRRPQLAVVPFNYPTDRAYEDLRERDASRPAVWIQRAGHRLAPTKHFLAADERGNAHPGFGYTPHLNFVLIYLTLHSLVSANPMRADRSIKPHIF